MQLSNKRSTMCAAIAALATMSVGAANAQDLGDILLEEIVVTATKRAGGIDAQDAAVAVTAYG